MGHAEIELGCHLVDGALKHFFDADDLRTLFVNGWRVRHLEERTIHHYENPKMIWGMPLKKVKLEIVFQATNSMEVLC